MIVMSNKLHTHFCYSKEFFYPLGKFNIALTETSKSGLSA